MPLISFDVGGIGEMLEYAEHGDVIVMESTAKALSQKLQGDDPCGIRQFVLQTGSCISSLTGLCILWH